MTYKQYTEAVEKFLTALGYDYTEVCSFTVEAGEPIKVVVREGKNNVREETVQYTQPVPYPRIPSDEEWNNMDQAEFRAAWRRAIDSRR